MCFFQCIIGQTAQNKGINTNTNFNSESQPYDITLPIVIGSITKTNFNVGTVTS